MSNNVDSTYFNNMVIKLDFHKVICSGFLIQMSAADTENKIKSYNWSLRPPNGSMDGMERIKCHSKKMVEAQKSNWHRDVS